MKQLNRTTRRKCHKIPIYNFWLDVVVCDSIVEERDKYSGVFGASAVTPGTVAYFSINQSICAIFFKRSRLTHGSIAHEVFHCLMAMLDSRGERPVVEHDEPAAYLCDYLTNLIYRDLTLWKEKIKKPSIR